MSFFVNHRPNDTHQVDTLYLPHDKVGGKAFKYALTVVGIAPRYKNEEAMTGRSATMIADAVTKIHARGLLRWPGSSQCDDGSEFKAAFNQLMLKKQIRIHRGILGNH